MTKKVLEKLSISVMKISNIGDLLLNDENHSDWEIESVNLVSKTDPKMKIICEWLFENGQWVKRCRPE